MNITYKILLFLIMGIFYLGIEVIVRIIEGSLIGTNGWTALSAVGWSSGWMILIGGLCGIFVGMINENRKFWEVPMIFQAFVGVTVTLAIELLSGIIFNLVLNLNIWDYRDLKFHFLGQICLQNAILFFLFMPFVIWFDDLLRCGIYKNKSVYPFLENYKRFFTGK